MSKTNDILLFEAKEVNYRSKIHDDNQLDALS